MDSGKYLPDFMRDFHDQKNIFKRLDKIVQSRNDTYTKDISWTSGQVYTVDIFLWFMAVHGYTLQQSRKKVEFHNIHNELGEFERKQQEQKADVLKSIFAEMAKKQLFKCIIRRFRTLKGSFYKERRGTIHVNRSAPL